MMQIVPMKNKRNLLNLNGLTVQNSKAPGLDIVNYHRSLRNLMTPTNTEGEKNGNLLHNNQHDLNLCISSCERICSKLIVASPFVAIVNTADLADIS